MSPSQAGLSKPFPTIPQYVVEVQLIGIATCYTPSIRDSEVLPLRHFAGHSFFIDRSTHFIATFVFVAMALSLIVSLLDRDMFQMPPTDVAFGSLSTFDLSRSLSGIAVPVIYICQGHR
jgi:hypothetical protein